MRKKISVLAFVLAMLPAILVLAVVVLSADAVWFLLGRWRRKTIHPDFPPIDTEHASIIILNWQGADLLAQSLPSVIEAVQYDGREHEIIVVDNGSSDGSADFVRKNFPNVRLVCLPENIYFTGGNNAGVKASTYDIVVFLNNDMMVDKGFLRPLLDAFKADNVFAASSQVFLWDPDAVRVETGKTGGRFKGGWLDIWHGAIRPKESLRHVPVLWAGGGSSAFDKRRFSALGGLDTLYDPFYAEDLDLSYRAWKRGWANLLVPESKVYHKHRGTNRPKYGDTFVDRVSLRNRFLFTWKNITDLRLILSHFLFLPQTLYRLGTQGKGRDALVFMNALGKLPRTLRSRLTSRQNNVLTDEEVFQVSARYAFFKDRFLRRPSPETNDRLKILMFCPYAPCRGETAGSAQMHQLISDLCTRHDVYLLTFVKNESYLRRIAPLRDRCKYLRAFVLTPSGASSFFGLFPTQMIDFRKEDFQKEVSKVLDDVDIDVIQAEYVYTAQYIPKLRQTLSVVFEHEVHFVAEVGYSKAVAGFGGKWETFRNILALMRYELRMCKKADRIVCVTDEDSDRLRKFNRQLSIRVISSGLDINEFPKSEVCVRPNSLVFVGSFGHPPNVDAMLFFCSEIFPLVAKEVPDLHLTIVGSNPPESIKDLEKLGNVTVTGRVEDVRPFVRDAAVYVAPLRRGTGLRIKVLEAWAMSKAVVATSLAAQGIRAVHEQNMLVADSPEIFAQHIVRLLHDQALRVRLGQAGRQTVEQYFSSQTRTTRFETLYFEGLREKRRGSRVGATAAEAIAVQALSNTTGWPEEENLRGLPESRNDTADKTEQGECEGLLAQGAAHMSELQEQCHLLSLMLTAKSDELSQTQADLAELKKHVEYLNYSQRLDRLLLRKALTVFRLLLGRILRTATFLYLACHAAALYLFSLRNRKLQSRNKPGES